MTGYVYAIGNDDIVKIGYSAKPAQRLVKVQSDNHVPVRLLGCRPGTQADERDLHMLFGVWHSRGEWFLNAGAVAAFVSTLEALSFARKPKAINTKHAPQLCRYLMEAGKSPSQFAKDVGVPTSTISRILNGQRRPRLETVARIHEVTGGAVVPNDFLSLPQTAPAQ